MTFSVFVVSSLVALSVCVPRASAATIIADLAVLCATPGGISAAVAAARAALPALPGIVLLEPSAFVGAVATSGVGLRDGGLPATIGGIAREWALLNGAASGNASELIWHPDNSVGEASFRALLAGSPNIQLITGAALSGARAAKVNSTVLSLPLLIGGVPLTVSARLYIDACYEGDSLALALNRSSWTYGREASGVYGESLAGVGVGIVNGGQNVGLPPANMSAYDDEGRLWDFVKPAPAAPLLPGAGDSRLEAAQYRVCVTRDPAIRVPFPRPAGYNATRFRALGAWATQGYASPPSLSQLVGMGEPYGAKRNKLDPVAQYNTFGLDAPGLLQHAASGLSYAETLPSSRERADIVAAHLDYGLSWFYTLANDAAVPAATRADVSAHGLCGDEWAHATPPHWPPQLYVREGARLVNDAVLTQSSLVTPRGKASGIAVGAWYLDKHVVTRVADARTGAARNEGHFRRSTAPDAPGWCGADPTRCTDVTREWYDIPLSALLPRRAEADNLLVPVGLAASSVAFSSTRIEAMLMSTGAAAGVTARLAASRGSAVQDVPVALVQSALTQEFGQRVQGPPVKAAAAAAAAAAGGGGRRRPAAAGV